MRQVGEKVPLIVGGDRGNRGAGARRVLLVRTPTATSQAASTDAPKVYWWSESLVRVRSSVDAAA